MPPTVPHSSFFRTRLSLFENQQVFLPLICVPRLKTSIKRFTRHTLISSFAATTITAQDSRFVVVCTCTKYHDFITTHGG